MNHSIVLHSEPTQWLREGSLASCEAPYMRWLFERGYANGTARIYLACLAHFARWATSQHLAPEDLSSTLVVCFLDEHLPCCDCPWPVQRRRTQVRAALAQLLPAMEAAAISFVESEPDAVERELDRFDAFQQDRRGLSQSTCLQRRRLVGDLLRSSLDKNGDPLPITAAHLRCFIAERLKRWSPASSAVLTGALRAYLRFRLACGDDVATLLPVIGTPANWRLAALPQTLTSGEVDRVLASFTPDVASRRRGCAIAHCVARLGLRASEVVKLELEDLQWEWNVTFASV